MRWHEDTAVNFFQTWFTGYINPGRAIGELSNRTGPLWGLYGVLIRSALVSLLWYLPAHLAGRTPIRTPQIAIIPQDTYYYNLVFLFPALTVGFWLIDGVLAHTLLRLMGRHSNFGSILMIDGFGNLIIGPLLLAWDWVMLTQGWGSDIVLWGMTHLVLDAWYIVFVILGLRKILQLPLWLAVLIVFLWFAYSVPLSMLFISP